MGGPADSRSIFDMVFNVRGEEATIHRWLQALPDGVVRSRPRLLLAQTVMASMRGDVNAMEWLLDGADTRPLTLPTWHSSPPLAGPAACW